MESEATVGAGMARSAGRAAGGGTGPNTTTSHCASAGSGASGSSAAVTGGKTGVGTRSAVCASAAMRLWCVDGASVERTFLSARARARAAAVSTAPGSLAPQKKHFWLSCAVMNWAFLTTSSEYTASCGSAADVSQSCRR